MNIHKEIGSDFGIPFSLLFSKNKNTLKTSAVALSCGRDCLDYLIDYLYLKEKGLILLPSYLCGTIIEPFKARGMKYGFYRITDKLTIDLDDLMKKIDKQKVSMILIINYFGFTDKNIDKIKRICEDKKIQFIEDGIHSFTNKIDEHLITYNSYRKCVFLPDGALLYGISEKNKVKIYKSFKHFLFIFCRSVAGIIKNFQFLKFIYWPLFLLSENKLIYYKRPGQMSRFSKFLLKKVDFNKVILRRRENFLYLLKNIKNPSILPIYNTLPKNVCPFGFPIIVKKREDLKKILVKNRIYPAVHWKFPEDISKEEFEESYELSNKIMTLPIDQRYTLKDMERIIETIKNAKL